MKPKTTTNVAINTDVHTALVIHIQSIDGKIGKWTEKAIKEKLDRDAKQALKSCE